MLLCGAAGLSGRAAPGLHRAVEKDAFSLLYRMSTGRREVGEASGISPLLRKREAEPREVGRLA